MVGLLIITHDQIGAALLGTATQTLGTCPVAVRTLAIPGDCDPDAQVRAARLRIEELDTGEGVLVLTDMYGSTPSNIAGRAAENRQAIVISGLNLPMLIRVLNYPRLGLRELARKAEGGGRDGIFLYGASEL